MNNPSLKYYLLIIFLPLLQVLLFNNINFMGYINPFIYPIFIVIYPLKKDKSALLLLSFLLGFLVDIITNDGGIHAFSLVFIAFIRLPLLKLLTPKKLSDIDEMHIKDLHFSSILLWIIILIFIHSTLLFLLEDYSFSAWGTLLKKSIFTTILSVILIIFGIQLFSKHHTNA